MKVELTAATKKPETPGEELFLVHLRRDEHMHDNPDDDEDIEQNPPERKRAKSIGEELFEVHLRRSQGLPPDYDVDPGEEKAAGTTEEEDEKKSAADPSNEKPEKQETKGGKKHRSHRTSKSLDSGHIIVTRSRDAHAAIQTNWHRIVNDHWGMKK